MVFQLFWKGLNPMKVVLREACSIVLQVHREAAISFCSGMGLALIVYIVLEIWSGILEIFVSTLLAGAFFFRSPDFEKFVLNLTSLEGLLRKKLKATIEQSIKEFRALFPEQLLGYVDAFQSQLTDKLKDALKPLSGGKGEVKEEEEKEEEAEEEEEEKEEKVEEFITDDAFVFGFLVVGIAFLSTNMTWILLQSTIFKFVCFIILRIISVVALMLGQIAIYVKYFDKIKELIKTKKKMEKERKKKMEKGEEKKPDPPLIAVGKQATDLLGRGLGRGLGLGKGFGLGLGKEKKEEEKKPDPPQPAPEKQATGLLGRGLELGRGLGLGMGFGLVQTVEKKPEEAGNKQK